MARTWSGWTMVLVVAAFCTAAAARDDDDPPYMSQFPAGVDQLRSRPASGNKFQFIFVEWIRLTHPDDNIRKLEVKVKAPLTPEAAWIIDGEVISDRDARFPQQWSNLLAAIIIPESATVTQIKLKLSLGEMETVTTLQLEDLPVGHTILEYGTDVALALSSQEVVTFDPATPDLRFVARFFAEDLIEGSYPGLQVQLLNGQGEITPDTNPAVISLDRTPTSSDVPGPLRERFDSALNNYTLVTISGSEVADNSVIQFTAEYDNNSGCRLFGGQRIERRVTMRHAS